MRRVVTAVMLLCSLVACGDDDTETPTTSMTSSPTTLNVEGTYIVAADRICEQLTTDIAGLHAPTSIEETAVYLQERILLATRARADLAAIDPPAGGEEVHRRLLEALDRSTAKAAEAERAASVGDSSTLAVLLDEARTLGQSAYEAADAYGMHACGSE